MKNGVCVIAPVIRSSWTTAFCQGEVVSRLFADRGWNVITAAESWEWPEKLLEVERAIARAVPATDVVIIGLFTSARRLELVAHGLTRARERGLRTILVLEGGAIPELCDEDPERLASLLARADVVVSTSAYLTQSVRRFGIPLVPIPNTIRIEEYPFRARTSVRPRLLWMRSFESTVYNPELAVRVLAQLLPRLPALTLTMAGLDDGGLEPTRELARELGVAGAVTFHDFIEMDEKRRLMDQADVFLNTNRSDNLPVSVMEAAAMGMPVVATDVGALAEIVVHEESGLLVPSDDVAAMAQATASILASDERAGAMSLRARAQAETFDASRTFPRWSSAFDQAMRS